MSPVIIGTAGHVDHGKTSLIRALTGIDTDRLKEERQRGMTIDLGFARIDLPDGSRIGIVDVPGHERFIKNMLAGAGGVDVALLVVAADEGVMPQTTEHLDILTLLGVRRGVIAVTKKDLVDTEALTLVIAEIRASVKESSMRDAPVIAVSARTDEGLHELKDALVEQCASVLPHATERPFRMPIDRAFSISGAGTVVTGTVLAGSTRPGDTVHILPGDAKARVRGVQAHGEAVEAAWSGMRAALNLVGVSKDLLERGMCCAAPDACVVTERLDAWVTVLPNAAPGIANQQRLRMHIGTVEALGRSVLHDTRIIEGESGFVQVRLEQPVVCARGDRFILRNYSPATTVAGGVVLIPQATKHRRLDSFSVELLQLARGGQPADVARYVLVHAASGLSLSELARDAGLSLREAADAAATLDASGDAVTVTDRVFASHVWTSLRDELAQAVEKFAAENPAKSAMQKDALKTISSLADYPKAFDEALRQLADAGRLELNQASVRIKGHTVQLNAKQQSLLVRLEQHLKNAGMAAPTRSEISLALGVPLQAVNEIIELGIQTGGFVKVSVDFIYPYSMIQDIKALVARYVQENGSINLGQFRDLTDSSRKYALPLLEYLDSVRFTLRSGDVRVLA